MRDSDIRSALVTLLWEHRGGESDTLIRHELGLCAGERRVDVAVINGELAGYEIKSDVDTLVRLTGQAEVYRRVLDRTTIVTTSRYVDKATEMLPREWGVMLAEAAGGRVALKLLRPATLNTDHDAMSVAQLLWRAEALDELRKRGRHHGLSNKSRWLVWERLIECVPISELQGTVRTRLKERQDWPGGL